MGSVIAGFLLVVSSRRGIQNPDLFEFINVAEMFAGFIIAVFYWVVTGLSLLLNLKSLVTVESPGYPESGLVLRGLRFYV